MPATNIIAKLKVKKEQPLFLLHAPAFLMPLFDSISSLKTKVSTKDTLTQLLLFAKDRTELHHHITSLLPGITDDTLLWVAYPKKSGSIPTDISRDNSWQPLQDAGYEPVMQIAIDNDWSAVRFKRKENISGFIREIPQEQRVTEGVDYITRTVTAPADLLAAIDKHPGMLTFFNAMSFTHKKEYVMAIVEAKKLETRQRRIEKMIEMLRQKMNNK